MKNFVYNLRNKPENVRKRILWFSVLFCMTLVIIIWFIDLQRKIIGNESDGKLKEAVNELIEGTDIKNAKSDIQSSVGNLMEGLETDIESDKVEEINYQQEGYKLPIE